MSALVVATGLGKRYRQRSAQSAAARLLQRTRAKEIWAVRGVDFDVKPGETLGVVGRNGAGKSTLLRLVAGIATATEGCVTRPPRVGSLIELGAGFHPELTGRENVAVTARLLGLSARETRERFEAIVEFAEMGHAIDQPARQYSSGMFVRLAFATVVHTRPDLLVVDEALAVGDYAFQVRCLEMIRTMKGDGVGVLFVTHDLSLVLANADRVLLLEGGTPVVTGLPLEAAAAYHRVLAERTSSVSDDEPAAGALRVEAVRLVRGDGSPTDIWSPGDDARIAVDIVAARSLEGAVLAVLFEGEGVGMVASWVPEHEPLAAFTAGERRTVEVDVNLNFGEGGYWLSVGLHSIDLKEQLALAHHAVRIGIARGPQRGGMVEIAPRFHHPRADEA